MPPVASAYLELRKTVETGLNNDHVSEALQSVIAEGLTYLRNCPVSPLASRIPGKEYFTFKAGDKGSRPVNRTLFDLDIDHNHLRDLLYAQPTELSFAELETLLYTSAMAYCCATDLTKRGDQKTPGTFFEILIGHLVAKTYDIEPRKSVPVLNLDRDTELPTDFVFDLGESCGRLHLPVKTSTRERIVQVWAHQRVLDGIYGVGRFRGILVCLAETNQHRKSNSVVEVCLPGQWQIYQMFIARMHRVYYLDVPAKYADLGNTYPFIQVKSFAAFFSEAADLVAAPST